MLLIIAVTSCSLYSLIKEDVDNRTVSSSLDLFLNGDNLNKNDEWKKKRRPVKISAG